MRKLLLIIALLISVISEAQIQRKFYDFTFGVTSKSQVINYFKTKGNRLRVPENNRVAVINVRFGGFDWGVAHFCFYKNKLYQVMFMSSENDSPKSTLDSQWELLNEKFSVKYSRYYLSKFSTNNERLFRDSQTHAKIEYSVFEGLWALSLIYYDIKLFDEKSSFEDDEL